ncbi:MAG: chloride channel protein [Desulfovibrio sp.]|nr:chloride channel protein [Desulfovibrio sp.]
MKEELASIWSSVHDQFNNPVQIIYLAFVGFIVGACGGAVIAVFRISKETAFAGVMTWLGQHRSIEAIAYFIVAALAALIVGRLIKNTAIRFGGAEWIREALADGQTRPWMQILIPKFLGIWLTLSAGVSVGSEGPCIEMGAATALGLKTFDKKELFERRFFILGGCAAGLSAAFSAPFAGICYVFEIMRQKLDKTLFVFLLGGSFGVYFSVTLVFGLDVMLPLGETPYLRLSVAWLLVALGIFGALAGAAYNYLLRLSIQIYKRQNLVPLVFRPLFPFLGAGIMMLVYPVCAGEGMAVFDSFPQWRETMSFLCLFVVIKLLFTAFCYGSGIPAGLMVPILCVGGAMGGIFADVAYSLNLLPPGCEATLVVMGMAAAFTAAECAPVTGVVLVTQMTGAFSVALPMLLVVFTAWCASRYLRVKAP